jgi:hypothetical protein
MPTHGRRVVRRGPSVKKLVAPTLVFLVLATPIAAANDPRVGKAISRLVALVGNEIEHLIDIAS